MNGERQSYLIDQTERILCRLENINNAIVELEFKLTELLVPGCKTSVPYPEDLMEAEPRSILTQSLNNIMFVSNTVLEKISTLTSRIQN